MGNPIGNIAIVAEIGPNLNASSASVPAAAPISSSTDAVPGAKTTTEAPAPTIPAENQRLVIEDDKAAGCFVYKIIDRSTGEIVQQLPSEQMVKLRESDGYLAGDVIKAQV